MEFNEKLAALRKERGLTQEELAEKLYVSRTAISKWESGRGYPNIDSLKAIAAFFSLSIDGLLSSEEAIAVAEESAKQDSRRICDLVFGLIDLSMLMLLFLPIFAVREGGAVAVFSLVVPGIRAYLRAVYISLIGACALTGTLTLALQAVASPMWIKCKTAASLSLGAITVAAFTVGIQPYAALLAFVLLLIKGIILIMRH